MLDHFLFLPIAKIHVILLNNSAYVNKVY